MVVDVELGMTTGSDLCNLDLEVILLWVEMWVLSHAKHLRNGRVFGPLGISLSADRLLIPTTSGWYGFKLGGMRGDTPAFRRTWEYVMFFRPPSCHAMDIFILIPLTSS